MIQEIASKKLSTKRSRRAPRLKGPVPPQSLMATISGASSIRSASRPSKDGRSTERARRYWTSLVTPMAKFDPKVVLEFYANAWPTEEGVRDMRSWVRGQWIPFDADALSQFLGDPLMLEEGQEYEFSQRRNKADGFDEEAIAQLLCTPGQDFAWTVVGRQVRIMRTNMTTLTQTWMTLLLSNVLPSDHNSDLPLPKYQLMYAILTRMSIHVAQGPGVSGIDHGPLLVIRGSRHPGVPTADHPGLHREAQGNAPQAADIPSPPHQVDPTGSLGMECYLQHLVRQQAVIHQGQPQSAGAGFGAEVAWPEAQAGEAPARSPGDAEEARMDEEMTDLLGFLGGSGAT
ncbi:hypothetical protein HKD37_16G045505 [Glycine soja]